MSNSDLITKGICPFCKKTVYTPSSSPTADLAYHVAVGLHMGRCEKSPEYKESDVAKYIRELLE